MALRKYNKGNLLRNGSQTVNGATTRYLLDLNAGLTQVLADETNAYLYGLNRIAQSAGTDTRYFLTDVLGSVRQLVDAVGSITLSQSFDPFGNPLQFQGTGTSSFGYAGEQTDGTGLQNLRARYFAPDTGTFLTRDTWQGDFLGPKSLNHHTYVGNSPIKYSDPSGHFLPFITAGVGAVVGLAVDAGFQIIPQLWNGTSLDQVTYHWQEGAGAAVAGAVAGGSLGLGVLGAAAIGETLGFEAGAIAVPILGGISGGLGNMFGNQVGALVQSAFETKSPALSPTAMNYAAVNHGYGNLLKQGVDFSIGALTGGYSGAQMMNGSVSRAVSMVDVSWDYIEGTAGRNISKAPLNDLGNPITIPSLWTAMRQASFYSGITSLSNYRDTFCTYMADHLRNNLSPRKNGS